MKAIRGTFCKSSCMASGKMAAVVASWQVAGPGSHCASSFFFWGAFGVSFDSCWPPQLVLQFFPPPFSKHPPSPWLSNEFSFALLTLGWFVFIVRNKRELAKETEKLIGQLRKRFFWKPVKKRFVSGRNWPRVSNLRAKSSKRRSERYLLNLPIRRSVSGRSVSSDRGARSTCQVEGRKPWVCRSCPEAAWLRGGRCHGATCLPGAQDQGWAFKE